MKALFDTSVLVPIFLADHEHHEASIGTFLRFEKSDACCSAHSLAEVYATVTRLPGVHRASAEHAMLFLQTIQERLIIVALNEKDYLTAIRAAADAGIAGGAIYDALIARCAVKVEAQTIFTWNLRHFRQVALGYRGKIKMP